MRDQPVGIPRSAYQAVRTLWDYHDLRHDLRTTDVAIGLGSHDLGVAVCAAQLFHRGLFPTVVFSGANAPSTRDRFPRGEAVHYAEHAVLSGVPEEAILIEDRATNTAENLVLSRQLLLGRGLSPTSVTLLSRPYQQRRAYATCRRIWPEVDVVCASLPCELDEYVRSIGSVGRVVSMLVGDTQRIEVYARRGFAVSQPIPDAVRSAYNSLVRAGYVDRLVPGEPPHL